MSKKQDFEHRYWRFYSLLLRIVGRLFILFGIVFLAWAVKNLIFGSKTMSKSDSIEMALFSLGAGVVGFLLIKVGKFKE